jgi:hypothetical protein
MIRARSLIRRPTRTSFFLLASVLILVVLTAAAFARKQAVQSALRAAPPQAMAAMLPQGALLTIESPDFAALLNTWSSSPQSGAWLKSADHSVFANSRLFGRLADAQSQFASTAALDSAGTSFLKEIAGHRSIFAWYDIGSLEFLYITRMDPAQARQTRLLQSSSRFSRRQAGSAPFFVRTQIAPDKTTQRAVAFATSGDLLFLATREDLMANALQLLQTSAAPSPANSLAREPWYLDALASQPAPSGPAPDLRMVLNLDRIVPLPYFRTYWIQRNLTEMSHFRTAVADLFRESTPQGPRFREERTLLAKSPGPAASDPNLAPLAALAPPSAGVFRAVASTDASASVSATVATIQQKLFGHAAPALAPRTSAPDPALDVSPEGSASYLETRIDTPAPVLESVSTSALAQLLTASSLNATLTVDSAELPAPEPTSGDGLWIPIHSAVVLRTDRPLDASVLRSALQQTLRGSLTAASLGIEFRPTPANPAVFALNGPKPLFLALSGNLCLLANDQPLLTEMLARIPASEQAQATPAALIAGFNHSSQRAPFARLTLLLDAAGEPSAPNTAAAPPFFSGNLRSLSDTFAALQSEHVLIRHQGEALRQTVLYQWQP